jgi:hypothetical protein
LERFDDRFGYNLMTELVPMRVINHEGVLPSQYRLDYCIVWIDPGQIILACKALEQIVTHKRILPDDIHGYSAALITLDPTVGI